MMQQLLKFYRQGEVPYGIFSNFPMRDIVIDGRTWRSSEIYFQAKKFEGTEHEDLIAAAADSQTAADMGRERTRPLRTDWDQPLPTDTGEWAENEKLRFLWTRHVGQDRPMLVKDYIMFVAVRAKFTQHEDYREVLVGTKDAHIVEHTKIDKYWADGGDLTGVNMLGKLLMIVRDMIAGEIRDGLNRHEMFGGVEPAYFEFYLVKPDQAAEAIKKRLLTEKTEMGEWANQFRVLFYVDVDTDEELGGMPYDMGLTPKAECFDVNMADIETTFARIDAACASIGPHAKRVLRFATGRFGPDEYDGMSKHSFYTKRMFYRVAGTWILFKNIQRRAGRNRSYWKRWAASYDKKDN